MYFYLKVFYSTVKLEHKDSRLQCVDSMAEVEVKCVFTAVSDILEYMFFQTMAVNIINLKAHSPFGLKDKDSRLMSLQLIVQYYFHCLFFFLLRLDTRDICLTAYSQILLNSFISIILDLNEQQGHVPTKNLIQDASLHLVFVCNYLFIFPFNIDVIIQRLIKPRKFFGISLLDVTLEFELNWAHRF